MLLQHLKSIALVGYPPRLIIYEISSVQSDNFVQKCGFCDFGPPQTIILYDFGKYFMFVALNMTHHATETY